MRYAQEVKGQRLHLVKEIDADLYGRSVETKALCGRHADNGWRMTINVPLASCCRNCRRVWRAWQSRISETEP